jgi:8-oxo-dGTP pyrophosphatase MutT (NUDIX family)
MKSMSRPEAAVAIVHTRSQPESVLLMRRSERPGDSWSGHWSLPGGRCEPADRDLVHTALRELQEECGLQLNDQHLETILSHVVARRKAPPYLLVAPFVFRVDTELPTTLDTEEAVESLWIPVAKLRDPEHHAMCSVPGRPREMLFPCIELEGAPLWGFTYRLLTDWMRSGGEQRPDGSAIADIVLQFLLSQGLHLRQPWTTRGGAPTAIVDGPIPVTAVISRFSGPGPHVIAMNTLDVQPDRVRLLGPSWEEYRIESTGNFSDAISL